MCIFFLLSLNLKQNLYKMLTYGLSSHLILSYVNGTENQTVLFPIYHKWCLLEYFYQTSWIFYNYYCWLHKFDYQRKELLWCIWCILFEKKKRSLIISCWWFDSDKPFEIFSEYWFHTLDLSFVSLLYYIRM